MTMKLHHFALCAFLAALSGAACSQTTVRLGAVHIGLSVDSPNLTSNGPAFLTPQPAGLDVRDKSTLLFSVSQRINEHFDAEIVLGVPPRHDVVGTGTLAPFGTISRVRQAAPTAFLNYSFFEGSAAFRPFVGVGVNYTRFYDAASTASGDLASGGPTRIVLTKSTGMAAQAGFTYKFDQRWSLCASVVRADVESDLTATTGSIERKTNIKFNPTAVSASLGYTF
jgi:outer membrane protein